MKALKDWLEYIVPKYMKEGRTPGASIAIVKEGQTIYAEGFGLRDPKRNLPATADTLYCVGSLTKSFVALAIMKLVEENKLHLDDPVAKYIPFKLGLPGKPILIKHLLSHNSGLPSFATSSVAMYKSFGFDTGIPFESADDFYRLVNEAQNEIVDAPGKRFFYHNAGYRMLGHIIQVINDMPFHHYIKEKILKPLGMERSTFNRVEFEADPDRSIPHWKKPDASVIPCDFPYPNPEDNLEFSFIAAAGGMISSVNEMTRYLIAQIEKGFYSDTELASMESFEKMQTSYVQRSENLYGQYGYGFGLGITPDFHGYKMISHGGSIHVSTAHMAFIPDLKLGIIMMANSDSLPYDSIAEGVFAILMGMEPEEAVPMLKIKERMERLMGEYTIYKSIERARVIKKEGMLYLEKKTPFTDSVTPLIPEDPLLKSTRFYTLTNGVKATIEFIVHSPLDIDLFVERYRYHKTAS